MKYNDVKFYDEETKALTLITGIKDYDKEEVETKTYQYPFFVKGIFTKKAVDLGEELESREYTFTSEMFDKLANFFVELYNNQFTKDELMEGINQGLIVNVFITMLFGVLQGDLKNE